jgi:hypothetical protein
VILYTFTLLNRNYFPKTTGVWIVFSGATGRRPDQKHTPRPSTTPDYGSCNAQADKIYHTLFANASVYFFQKDPITMPQDILRQTTMNRPGPACLSDIDISYLIPVIALFIFDILVLQVLFFHCNPLSGRNHYLFLD